MPQDTNTIDVNALRKELGLDQITEVLKAQQEKDAKAEAAIAAKAREEAEQKRMEDLVAKATGETKQELQAALSLIKELDTKYKTDTAEGAKALEAQQELVVTMQDQIKQLLSARDGRSFVADNVAKALYGDQETFEDTAEKLVLLAYIMEKDVFETEHGAAHLKAVNSSSSIEMSSDAYETIFSNRILRDIQAELIVGDLFDELPMNSKTLTMLVEPEAGRATWVDASTYGTPATTGNEVKGKLSEITFRTFKLAAKSFITDETEEDAIFTLLPLLRKRLIEAHVVTVEETFMNGDGNGKPLGLIRMARADGKVVATDAGVGANDAKVTAKSISMLRRGLGRHGLNLSKLVLIISMDAYYDLLEDEEWQDVTQVGSEAVKLSGQVGRIYGLPVVVSEYFPAKEASSVWGLIVYKDNFVVPRQRAVTVERERQAERQRDAYYVTQRLNLQRYFENGIVAGAYKA